MKKHVDHVLTQFLKQHCPNRPAMLLGLSGGPDSMALFHMLCDQGYPFEAAHLDHGWRQESQKEALYLEKLCFQKKIPFHLFRLPPLVNRKNLEEKGREARQIFFKEIVEEKNLHGVFLAHHADDQAETVLKRIFEGATLAKWSGLKPVKIVHGIPYFRPFLKIRKKEILLWLGDKNITYFQDVTNHDPHFLRTRLREKLLPSLTHSFGKEIAPSLCRIGESASELSEFLVTLVEPYLKHIKKEQHEIEIDLTQNFPSHAYLCKLIISHFFYTQKMVLSQHLITTISDHLSKGNSRHELKVGKKQIMIVHRRLILKLVDRERSDEIC